MKKLQTQAWHEKERAEINKLLNETHNKKQAITARETLTKISRLSSRINNAIMAELIVLGGMFVCNQIDHDAHLRAGLFVYPAMIVVAIYIAYLHDTLDKQKDIYKGLKDPLVKKIDCQNYR